MPEQNDPKPLSELMKACAEENDRKAWEELVSRLDRPIRLSIIRKAKSWGGLAPEIVRDLTQDTYLKLCEHRCQVLLKFAACSDEVILAYMKTIAINVTLDWFKSRGAQKRGAGKPPEDLENFDPESPGGSHGGHGAMFREAMFRQMDDILRASLTGRDAERDRSIFWLYYRQGMTAQEIAALPTIQLTAKGVESVIRRLTRDLGEGMAA